METVNDRNWQSGETKLALLDEATKQLLTEQWLPRLRELRDQRKLVISIMIATILVPLAIVLSAIIYLMFTKDLDIAKTGVCGMLLGLSAIAFVYLARIQNCNDVIVVIEFSVYLGDRDEIIKSISHISCFGKMQDLLRDIRPFLKESLR